MTSDRVQPSFERQRPSEQIAASRQRRSSRISRTWLQETNGTRRNVFNEKWRQERPRKKQRNWSRNRCPGWSILTPCLSTTEAPVLQASQWSVQPFVSLRSGAIQLFFDTSSRHVRKLPLANGAPPQRTGSVDHEPKGVSPWHCQPINAETAKSSRDEMR